MNFHLSQHPRYGQCAVASRDLLAGEVVIDERPVLVIDYSKDALADDTAVPTAYRRKRGFMTLSRPAKVSLAIAHALKNDSHLLQGMFTPRLSKSTRKTVAFKAADRGVSELRKRRALFPELKDCADVELINHSLLASANAHSFDDHSIALLAGGCKVSHSCFQPNVAVSTRPYRGVDIGSGVPTAKHIALRDIKKGEVLLGSYAKLTTYTAVERRNYLLDHKMFVCQCDFCSGPDLTRGVICEVCVDRQAEVLDEIAPLSTMYRRTTGDAITWDCRNCKSTASEAYILARENSRHGESESSMRSLIYDLETRDLSPKEHFDETVQIYSRCLVVFGWRHTYTASAALNVLDGACKAIDASQSPDLSEIHTVLGFVETLPPLLEKWFIYLGVSANDELTSIYLLMSEQLMTLSALHHEIIPRAMSIVQDMLLKIRPVVEERRSWKIGHALEDYYDEQLVMLHDLVNGSSDAHGEVLDA